MPKGSPAYCSPRDCCPPPRFGLSWIKPVAHRGFVDADRGTDLGPARTLGLQLFGTGLQLGCPAAGAIHRSCRSMP